MNKRLGIIAGSGDLPIRLAKTASQQCWEGCIIKISNFAKSNGWPEWPIYDFHIGKINSIFSKLHNEKITHVILCGGIQRPSLMDLNPDIKAVQLMAKISFKGDDGALRIISEAIENEGFKVLPIEHVLKDSLAPLGHISGPKPTKEILKNIDKAIEVLIGLSSHDIGQSIVVQQGLVLAIEAIEGTDLMISRAGKLKLNGNPPILVKAPKLGQDLKMDQPVIGPKTIDLAIQYGFSAIACAANQVIIVDLSNVISKAKKYKITLYGFEFNK